jgi:hypothetical protein
MTLGRAAKGIAVVPTLRGGLMKPGVHQAQAFLPGG